MATIIRSRLINHRPWTAEGSEVRSGRRALLCELDGLLTQLEEINMGASAVPARLRLALQRHGIVMESGDTAADMIEAIFVQQERYMLRPEQPRQAPRDLGSLRRRIAV